ncbi:MAG: TrmH family RNA methyltransferase [Bdellovibrionales bacterium]|nr:TrmH family RNA methyltransferase [Bdellovibrionales bacterium]
MNRKIEKIYQLFREIEQNHLKNNQFLPSEINQLKEILLSLKDSRNVELQKIYSIHYHLSDKMSLQEFCNWLVPIERFLNKNLKDEDFLIFNKDQLSRKDNSHKIPLVIILDHVRSSFNVGSIFRSAEAFNIEKIYLVGYTPDPTNAKTNKTTLGADQFIQWESVPKIHPLIHKLKSDGYRIIAAETTSHAISLHTPFSNSKTAFIFGNERFGLDADVISACDETRILNLSGYKNSLNIANCASIFIYEFNRQLQGQVYINGQ